MQAEVITCLSPAWSSDWITVEAKAKLLAYGIAPPQQPFECTVVLARRTWRMPKNDLATLARFIDFKLNHHEAGSDAEACARILLAARAHLAKQSLGD